VSCLPPCSTLFPYTTLFRSTPTPESFYSDSPREVVRVLRPTGLPSLVEAQRILEDAGRSSSAPVYLIENSGASSVGKYWLTQLRSEEHTSELQSRFDLVCRL